MRSHSKCVLGYLVVLSAFSFSVSTYGQGFPNFPSQTLLHGEAGNGSGIDIQCTPIVSDTAIDCQFYQMRLSSSGTEIDAEKKIEQYKAELEATPDSDLMDELKDLCKAYQENRQVVEELFGGYKTKASKEYGSAFLSLMKSSCDTTTLSDAKAMMFELSVLSAEREAATCKVWTHSWEERFDYQPSGDYWVSRAGPNGSCGVILVSTLKHDDDYSALWNYESQKIITNKKGEGFLLECNELDEETVLHTWRSTEHEVQCDVFKFGL